MRRCEAKAHGGSSSVCGAVVTTHWWRAKFTARKLLKRPEIFWQVFIIHRTSSDRLLVMGTAGPMRKSSMAARWVCSTRTRLCGGGSRQHGNCAPPSPASAPRGTDMVGLTTSLAALPPPLGARWPRYLVASNRWRAAGCCGRCLAPSAVLVRSPAPRLAPALPTPRLSELPC